MVDSVSSATNSSIIDQYLAQQEAIKAADQSEQKSSSLAKLTGDYDTFLKLLTTQMQYQDPLAPTDPSEYTKQLTTFAQVEQSISTNDKLDQLISLNTNAGVGSLIGYIGKYVEANTGDDLSLRDGKAQIAYQFSDAASSVEIVIKDAEGNEVRRLDGSGGTDARRISWDGKDEDGTQLADGAYTFEVTAKNSDGDTIKPSATSTIIKVTGVANTTEYGNVLSSGEILVLEDMVLSVHDGTTS